MRPVVAVVVGVLLTVTAGLAPEALERDRDPGWLTELCTEYQELNCEP